MIRSTAYLIPFVAVAAFAQEPQRLTLPDPAAKTKVDALASAERSIESAHPAPVAVSPQAVLQVRDLGDEPDFAPTEEVRGPDGSVVAIRLKGNPYVLSFDNGTFAPERGVDPNLLRALTQRGRAHVYGYIMLRGRMAESKMERLQGLGAKLLGRHTYQSVKAKIPVDSVTAIADLPFVHWVGYSQPHQKFDTRLARALADVDVFEQKLIDIYITPFESDQHAGSRRVTTGEREGDGLAFSVQTEEWIPDGPFQKALEAKGFRFDWFIDQIGVFKGRATKRQILEMQKLDFVQTIELFERAHTFHDQAMSMTSQDRVRLAYPGKLVPIGVIDTGLDTSPVRHQDFGSKSLLGFRTTTAATFNDGSGHGTHVSGTIFGRGNADPRYTGCAPDVGMGGPADSIYIGRFLDDAGKAQGNVGTLYNSMAQAYKIGTFITKAPSIINNSWGQNAAGGWKGTDADCRLVDQQIFLHKQGYVFAVGNKGTTSNSYAATPGSAKNVLTVGGVRDHWASGKPGDVYSSSRWQTADNRIKPDVAAPGEVLTSCNINTTTGYTNKSGTSMAAPMVSGALASLVDRVSSYERKPEVMKAIATACATVDGVMLPNGTKAVTAKRGHGLINAYRMLYSSSRSRYDVRTSTFNKTGQSAVITLPIESNLVAMKVTLAWVEGAASSLSSQARINELRAYIDAPNYDSRPNVGDAALLSGTNTVLWYSTYTGTGTGNLVKAMQGRNVRFKVYAQSVGSDARWALVVLRYFRDPLSHVPALTSAITPAVVKPSANATLNATINGLSTKDEFTDARVWVDSAAASRGAVNQISRTTADNIAQIYKVGSFPSNPFPSVVWGPNGGMTIGQGVSRSIQFALRAPSANGVHKITTNATYHGSSTLQSNFNLCVDGLAPLAVPNLVTTTHKPFIWTNTSAFAASWSTASDVGCSGLNGYASAFNRTNPKVPTLRNMPKTRTSVAATLTDDPNWYFTLRAVDLAGNLGPYKVLGPFRVDTVKPTTSSVSINNGAAFTNSLRVGLAASATDSMSGVSHMRYSSNGTTFSGWQSYTASSRPYSLSNYGGTTGDGTKSVYVQVKDLAGNESALRSDTIVLDRTKPALASVTINDNAAYTTDLTVQVKVAATDKGSGVKKIRYSSDGITWSPSFAYTTGRRAYSLSSYGGSARQGLKRVFAQVTDTVGNVSDIQSDTIVLDSINPTVGSVVINNGATYTSSLTVSVTATTSDSGSGVTDIRYSSNGSIWSAWSGYSTGARPYLLSSNGGSTTNGTKSVYVQVRDAAGNLSTSKLDTIVFDSTKPVVSAVSINAEAAYTTSLNVVVTAVAADGASSVKDMRHSSNGTTWSPWTPYSTASQRYALQSFGGTANEGLKRVYVQVRDGAGNESLSKFDTITYERLPNIAGGNTSLPSVHNGSFGLTGTDFKGVTRVSFGRSNLTIQRTAADDDPWATGAFEIVNDGLLRVYAPPGLAPQDYTVVFHTARGASNPFVVKIVDNPTRVLLSHRTLTAGKPVTVMAHRGKTGAGTGIVVISPLNTPSTVPGLVSLGIGANFTALVELPGLPFNGHGVMSFTVPTQAAWRGLVVYMQTVYLANPLPLPVSNVWKITLK